MMKGIFLALLFCAVSPTPSAEAPRVQLISTSLMIHPGTSTNLGGRFTSSVMGDLGYKIPNHEIAMINHLIGHPPTYYHGGVFILRNEENGSTEIFQVLLNLPFPDSNTNGFPDVFEFGPSISATSTGEYFSFLGEAGRVDFEWAKNANSHLGDCRIRFDDGRIFQHRFELFEYAGIWPSAPAADGVAAIHWARSGVPGEFLEGDIYFDLKEQVLRLHAATLKTASGAPFQWLASSESHLHRGQLVFGVAVLDGTPVAVPNSTNQYDFTQWTLFIEDQNDWNENGSPDLIDLPPTGPPIPPTLEIQKFADRVEISFLGEMGRLYRIDHALGSPGPEWTLFSRFRLQTPRHIFAIHFRSSSTPQTNFSQSLFFRVQVE